ncbi:hypothetical protein J6590_006316 [Homalodisca vitripennis]|nr:hypothetical protein J6590_006316 [Homalodisca vitripennis]
MVIVFQDSSINIPALLGRQVYRKMPLRNYPAFSSVSGSSPDLRVAWHRLPVAVALRDPGCTIVSGSATNVGCSSAAGVPRISIVFQQFPPN